MNEKHIVIQKKKMEKMIKTPKTKTLQYRINKLSQHPHKGTKKIGHIQQRK